MCLQGFVASSLGNAVICAGGGGRKAGNGLILVFDFGGGTLDVSMLGLSDGVFVTLAIAGKSTTVDYWLPLFRKFSSLRV